MLVVTHGLRLKRYDNEALQIKSNNPYLLELNSRDSR